MSLTRLSLASLCALALTSAPALAQNTHVVTVGPSNALEFEQQDLNINVGDTVLWVWDGSVRHDVVSVDGAFQSAFVAAPNTFSVTFDNFFLAANPVANDFYAYFCSPHQGSGMVGSIQVLPERILSAPLVAGQSATISVTGANPGNTVIIAYSVAGSGPFAMVYGSLALSPPFNQLPPQTADGAGAVNIPVSIPPGLAGTTVFLHAAEILGGGSGILTNPVSVTL